MKRTILFFRLMMQMTKEKAVRVCRIKKFSTSSKHRLSMALNSSTLESHRVFLKCSTTVAHKAYKKTSNQNSQNCRKVEDPS